MAKKNYVTRTLDFLSENFYFSWFWKLLTRSIGLTRTFFKNLPGWFGLFGPFKTLFEGIIGGYAAYKSMKKAVQHRMEHIIAGSANVVGAIFNITVGILLLVGVIQALTLPNPFTFIIVGVSSFLALVNLWKDIRIYRHTKRELALTRLLSEESENTPENRVEKYKKIHDDIYNLEKKLTNQKITFIFHAINWIILGLGIVGLFFPPVMILTACLAATSAITEMVIRTEWVQEKLHPTPIHLQSIELNETEKKPKPSKKLENSQPSNDKHYTYDEKNEKTKKPGPLKKAHTLFQVPPKDTENPTTERLLSQPSRRSSFTSKGKNTLNLKD